jgi:hypothetical protein
MKASNVEIKLVDGFKIRNTLDIDFTVFHYSSNIGTYFAPKFYIPENEGWLDYRFKNEKDSLIALEDVEFPNSIKSFTEQREYLKKHFVKDGPIPSFKLSEKQDDELKVIEVDGKIVREFIDPEFVFGGHHYVYDYVPQGELWLDVHMDPLEIPFVQLHEKVEWEFMRDGKNYDIAHEYANTIEKEQRRLQGFAAYPGDDSYTWVGQTNEELAKKYYVS